MQTKLRAGILIFAASVIVLLTWHTTSNGLSNNVLFSTLSYQVCVLKMRTSVTLWLHFSGNYWAI